MTDTSPPPDTNTPKPWERQPWETDAMFAAFQVYLGLENPRSVERAFRVRYPVKAEDKRKTTGKRLGANGTWHNWASGRNYKGDLIPGALRWSERAAALDDHLAALRVAKWEELHMSAAEALARLANIARGDIADFADVRLAKDLKDNPNSALVKKLDTTAIKHKDGKIVTRTKLELYPADDAIKTILKAAGGLTDRVDVTTGGKPLDETIDRLIKKAYSDDDADNRD